MPTSNIYFGIDLGTSNCSVAYVVPPYGARRAQPKVVEFENKQGGKETRFPSLVAKNRRSSTGKLHFGFEADENGNWTEKDRTFFGSVKSLLGSWRSFVDAFLPDLRTPAGVWGKIIEELCNQARRRTPDGADPRKCMTVLTVPASFSQRQRQETIAAAKAAGFEAERLKFIDEPVAAVIDWIHDGDFDRIVRTDAPTKVLVFDFGGGTCDLSLVEVQHDRQAEAQVRVRNLAISPFALLGGDTIDLAIVEHIWPQIEGKLGVKRDLLPADNRQSIENGVKRECRKLKEQMCKQIVEVMKAGGGRRGKRSVPDAEVSLDAVLCKQLGFTGGRRVSLSEEGFREVMEPFLDPEGDSFMVNGMVRAVPIARLIKWTLERAGVDASELNVILMHGGSCRNPLVREALESMVGVGGLFGECVIAETPDLDASVARGAALHSYYLNAKNHWFVPPITAEDLGIITKGDRVKVVVPGGTKLPFPGEGKGWHIVADEFRLSEDNQEAILVPVHVGEAPEGKIPNAADAQTFPLPTGTFKDQPVEVNVRIDENKLVQWRFRLKGMSWVNTDPWKNENPWVQARPTTEHDKLLSVRAEIRNIIEKGQAPSPQLLAVEAYMAARAGQREEAIRLIENVVRKAPDDARVLNHKALIHSIRREIDKSIEAQKRAWEIAPDDAVLRGNYGTALVELKRYDEAVEIMRGALALNPVACRYLHGWIADALTHLGRMDEVREEVQRWLHECRRQASAYPDSEEAWSDLEQAARRAGQYGEADDAGKKHLALVRQRQYGGRPEDLLEAKEF